LTTASGSAQPASAKASASKSGKGFMSLVRRKENDRAGDTARIDGDP
jgi:hypothetical protein